MYAEVLIEYPTKKIDKYFTYKIPNNLDVLVGMKVKVPFNNRIINGFVINIKNEYNDTYELKEIVSIEDKELILNKELINIGKLLKETTLCPLITAYQTMLPVSLKIKDKHTDYNYYQTYIVLNRSKEEIKEYLFNYKKNNKQTELLNILLNNNKILKKECNISALKSLKDKELVKEIKESEYRINKEKDNNLIKHQLNSEQLNAYNIITNDNSYHTYLLEGVTGSGKTEVYLNIIDNVLKSGKSAILLVPEITLTVALVKRLYDWFGSLVSVLHSALSNGEKYDEYLKIIRGESKIVVGTRSSIFAPLQNIGVIIVDECHSDTYKQENMPRYNAIDIAEFRCKYHNIPLVIGSATPLLEQRARAVKGIYKYLKLTKRAGFSTLPNVSIIDMGLEIKKGNFIFSEELINNINNTLNKKEQIVILLNRRGYSTIITCSNCGYTYKCPNCDITLTYHKSTNNLRCHYCGYTKIKDNICPNCQENSLNYLGIGTEKVESELNKLFPMARIVRMDQDTTSKKGSHEKIINSFKNYEYDILLGTQMISKGLDFPKVTLVGIINADSTLNMPSFRSNERTFSLLYQASGRAGRSSLPGQVILQTYNPDNFVLNCVKENDFNKFYELEMANRKLMKYPPYYYLTSLKVISSDYKKALEYSTKVGDYLKKNLDSTSIVLGPTTANIFKFNNMYHFQIVIKYRFDKNIKECLKYLDNIFININDINLEIDINAVNI